MDSGVNQREFTRVRVAVAAKVQAGERNIQVQGTRSLSMKGLFVETAEAIPEGTDCCVTILLGEAPIEVRAEGRVVRSYPDGFAVQFEKILGLESFEHLKNLVTYNAQDPSRIEQELGQHLGIRRKG